MNTVEGYASAKTIKMFGCLDTAASTCSWQCFMAASLSKYVHMSK